MASDEMEIDDPRVYNTSRMAPQYSPVPPQLAGMKRSRSEFEAVPQTYTFATRAPGAVREQYWSDPPPAMRLLHRIVGHARWAADATLGAAGRGIWRSAAAARAYLASRAPAPQTTIPEPSSKRRKIGMPGTFPVSPVNAEATTTTPAAAPVPPKFVGINHAAPGEDSPFTKLTKLTPAEPAASQPHQPIQAMPAALPTATMPQKTAEIGLPTASRLRKTAGNGPTPPDSRPTSSHSNEDGNTNPFDITTAQAPIIQTETSIRTPKAPIVQKETEQKKTRIPRPDINRIMGRKSSAPPPIHQSTQPKSLRASYRQPFYPEQVSPNAVPPKSILKNKTRDAEIESLITKAKTVVIESPEEKAVRFTYRQRKKEEARRNEYALRVAREAMEDEIEREREAEELAFREAGERKKLELERLRKEEEERKVAEAAAEKQRLKDEAKKQAAAEAEERRIAQEAKLAAKSAKLKQEHPDEDQYQALMLQLVRVLPAEWIEKIHQAMSVKNMNHKVATSPDGAELTRRDFGSLLPQEGTTDDPSGWLNDEMVNGMLATIVATKKARDGYKKGKGVPTFEAYSSAWYTTYKSGGGISKLARWSKRKGIDGKKLLKCHRIFFPINTGNHWMLLVISPYFGTIEFFDSLPNSARRAEFFAIARKWLAMELGADYKPSEWTDLDSESERQTNSNDCGVFTCFNALASAKYLPPFVVDPTKMPEARQMMAAILMKGSLEDEFKL